MTTRRRTARRGITLTEVLVAIFIMGVGMLALLTLFPLGAMQIGQALRDDRCAQTASHADGFIRQYWRTHYLEPTAAGRFPTDDMLWAADDPNLLWRGAHESHFEGYTSPVYVDQYVGLTDQSYPAPGGHLLPTGMTLANVPPGTPPFPPLLPVIPGYPGTMPSLQSVTFIPAPSRVAPVPPPWYQQPAFPALSPYRYSQVGPRIGTVQIPGMANPVPVASYPVLIDPLGYLNRTGMGRVWAAGMAGEISAANLQNQLRLPRRTIGLNDGMTTTTGRRYVHGLQLSSGSPYTRPLQYAPGSVFWTGAADPRLFSPSNAFQTATLTDDLTYEANGAPGATVSRQGRYTWAAVLQRPQNDDLTTATMTIMVFDGRSPSLAVAGDEAMVNPDAPIAVGARQITLSLPARTSEQSVLIRRGGWIMDGTCTLPTPLNPLGIRNAHHYRMTGVTEIGPTATGGVQYVVDIDPPFKGPVPPTAAGVPPQTQLYLFAGLAEVFERPVLKSDTKYQP